VKVINQWYVDQDVVMHDQVEVKHGQDVVLLVQQSWNHRQIKQMDNNYQLLDVRMIDRYQLIWS
jgi:hypothetical protein